MSSCKGLRFPGNENAAKEPTCALVCICKLRHCLNMCRCVRAVAHIPVSRSGSCVGHPNRDKVKENACCWHYWEKRTRRVTRSIAHIFAHSTNKQRHQLQSLYITLTCTKYCIIIKYRVFSVYTICQKNLPLNMKHLQSLTQGRDHIHHDVLMLSTQGVLRLLDTG